MAQLPNTIEEAIAQAKEATQAALDDGHTRVQVELVFPEIELQAQSISQQFIPLLEDYGSGLKLLFPDTGAAALARRDWGETVYKVSDIGTSRSPVEMRIQPEDEAFLIVSPSAVEVAQVEKLCNLAGDRPCILLNPQMEDISVVGIGYAARQLRDRFLSTLESCYYLKPLAGAALRRSYPGSWEVWLETEGEYQLIAQQPNKPAGEVIDQIILKATSPESNTAQASAVAPQKTGLFNSIGRFLKALSN
ncbi:MAG: DUF1995 family protein [Symploca sp. SIO3C6]|nr:DUF1995 family protein [Symploca sp. SIO3C6]